MYSVPHTSSLPFPSLPIPSHPRRRSGSKSGKKAAMDSLTVTTTTTTTSLLSSPCKPVNDGRLLLRLIFPSISISIASSSSSRSMASSWLQKKQRRERLSIVAQSYSAPRRPSERSYRGGGGRPSEGYPNVSELDIQEQIAQLDLEPHKLLVKGDPNSMQAIIKDVMPVGYFVSLPTGRDGYLPADDLGFTGGLAVLQRLFKEGQEITVRIVCRGGAGREIVSIKKPEFAPPSEQKTIESLRLHFENEKKNRMNPRNRRHQNYNNSSNY